MSSSTIFIGETYARPISDINEPARFGYGNHVCPGRFFAIRLIKIIFSKLITEYDFSWDRTEPGQPARLMVEGISAPNPTQRIRLQRRVL